MRKITLSEYNSIPETCARNMDNRMLGLAGLGRDA